VQELALDTALADIFNISRKRRKGVRPAHEMFCSDRKPLIDNVAYWETACNYPIVTLVESSARVWRTWSACGCSTRVRIPHGVPRCPQPRSHDYLIRGKSFIPDVCRQLPSLRLRPHYWRT